MNDKNKRPSQAERIIQYMRDFGSITSREAMNDLGCMRLASRISELRKDGYEINRRMIKVRNRYGESCTVAEYYLGED
ncbi:MAG: helix-turn-helix domain-containing protein [Clostridia bacterium]|nr:helix-turn-helix domain-containing protein [Clostridia bacterium]